MNRQDQNRTVIGLSKGEWQVIGRIAGWAPSSSGRLGRRVAASGASGEWKVGDYVKTKLRHGRENRLVEGPIQEARDVVDEDQYPIKVDGFWFYPEEVFAMSEEEKQDYIRRRTTLSVGKGEALRSSSAIRISASDVFCRPDS